MEYTTTHQYAHTIAFASVPISTGEEQRDMEALKRRQSLGRRVSFAPNAHVRQVEPCQQQHLYS